MCLVHKDERGLRRRGLLEALAMMEEATLPDWEVQGPRMTKWLRQFIRDKSGNPRSRTQRAMTDPKVGEQDHFRGEHGVLIEALEQATEVSNLVSFEVLFFQGGAPEGGVRGELEGPLLRWKGPPHGGWDAEGGRCARADAVRGDGVGPKRVLSSWSRF